MHGDDDGSGSGSENENENENASDGNVDVANPSKQIAPSLMLLLPYRLDLVLSSDVPLLSDSSLLPPIREREAELSTSCPSSPSHLSDFRAR